MSAKIYEGKSQSAENGEIILAIIYEPGILLFMEHNPSQTDRDI